MKSVTASRFSHCWPGGRTGTHPREVDLHAVVVVLPGDLLKDAQLVVADSLNREIPVAVQTLPDGVSKGLVPRVDEPVGVLLFHGQPWSAARHVVVRAVDAVGEERLQSPAARLIQERLDGVESRLLPLAVGRSVDEGENLAGPVGLVTLGEVPPHAVDARLRVVDELEEDGLHVLDVDARQVHHRGEDVEVHDDAAVALDGRNVVGGEAGAHGSTSSPRSDFDNSAP